MTYTMRLAFSKMLITIYPGFNLISFNALVKSKIKPNCTLNPKFKKKIYTYKNYDILFYFIQNRKVNLLISVISQKFKISISIIL